jgi:outer membrane lipoprotein carrier protein
MAMRRLLILTSLSALLFAAAPPTAAAISASEVALGVESKYSALKDLSAEFRQESRIVTLGRSRVKSGTIRFEKPGRMRWDYLGPDPQLLVSDGSTLWFYRPGQKQVVVQDISDAFTNQTPLLFLFGEGSLEEAFKWDEKDLEKSGDGVYTLAMRPREETPDLVALTLEVRARDFSIGATVLEDAFGNVTRLEFSGEQENQGLLGEIFTFQIPEGTEVVRP